MIAVVTGATGHVGTNLVPALLDGGFDVRAVAPVPGPDARARWVAADVRDQAAMRRVLDGADVVLHLAAVISVAGDRGGLVPSVNIGGVRATARAARDAGVRRFVHCSSVHAFDLMACRGRPVDEGAPRSAGPRLPVYDRSKAAGERALREVVADGLDAVVVNPTGIIGPADPMPSRMGAVLLAAATGRLPATVQGSFDWVDVRDVVAALVAAVDHGTTGENYLVGGHGASVTELVALACSVRGRRPPRAEVPSWLAHVFAPLASGLARRSADPLLYTFDSLHALDSRPTVDCAKAERALGHRPRPLVQTVTDLMDWFVRTGRLDPVG